MKKQQMTHGGDKIGCQAGSLREGGEMRGQEKYKKIRPDCMKRHTTTVSKKCLGNFTS